MIQLMNEACRLATRVFQRRDRLSAHPLTLDKGDLGIERVLGRLSAPDTVKPMTLDQGLGVILRYFVDRFVEGNTECIDSVLKDLRLVAEALEQERLSHEPPFNGDKKLKESYRLWQRGFGEGLSLASYLAGIPEAPVRGAVFAAHFVVLVDPRVASFERFCHRYGFEVDEQVREYPIQRVEPYWVLLDTLAVQRVHAFEEKNGVHTHSWSLAYDRYGPTSVVPAGFSDLVSAIALVGYLRGLPGRLSCIDAEVKEGTPLCQIVKTDRGIRISLWDGIPWPERRVVCTF